MFASADMIIPYTKSRPYLKPYLKKDDAKSLHDEARTQKRYCNLVENGKTHNKDDAFYLK